MKKFLPFLALAVAAFVYFKFFKAKAPAKKVAPGPVNTGTNTKAPEPWSPVVKLWNDAQTKSASDVAVEAANALPGVYNSVKGLFGGSSKATGTASPKTSGSGTGTAEPDFSQITDTLSTFDTAFDL